MLLVAILLVGCVSENERRRATEDLARVIESSEIDEQINTATQNMGRTLHQKELEFRREVHRLQNADDIEREFILKVAALEPVDLNSTQNEEHYVSTVTRLNDLIDLYNRERGSKIPLLDTSKEGLDTLSRKITEYGPLVKDYNTVVFAARDFRENETKENRQHFFVASGTFCVQTAIIVGSFYAVPAYKMVGFGYRALGLNRYAFTHPTLIKSILSKSHWFVRTRLVEESKPYGEEVFKEFSDHMYTENHSTQARSSFAPNSTLP